MEADDAQPPPKRLRRDAHADDDGSPATATAEPSMVLVQLNPADCNLDFDIGLGRGLEGQTLHEDGFAYCWSGARATVGVRGRGKYCFGCKIVAEQSADKEDIDADQRHLCRVGVSRGDEPVGCLGESLSGHSFGYEGTGRFYSKGIFAKYGVPFSVGDTITCAIDFESSSLGSIGFSRNGNWLGIAQSFDASEKCVSLVNTPRTPMPWASALYPHVLLKNLTVQMQFSREDGLEPVDGYEPWASAFADGIGGPLLAKEEKCELIVMVGLPASGKTRWAERWVQDHPEKRFIILGTKPVMEQMKDARPNRFYYYQSQAESILKTLLNRAANIPHNYIIDQSNVSKIPRIRLLSKFANFHKTAVVVFPSPSELTLRAKKCFRETFRLPSEDVNRMTALFVLPLSKNMAGSIEQFDEVNFVELPRDEAQRNLDNMKLLLPKTLTATCQNFTNQNSDRIVSVGNSSGSNVQDVDMTLQQVPSGAQDSHSTTGKDNKQFVMWRKIDLEEMYEAMQVKRDKITYLSKDPRAARSQIAAEWASIRQDVQACIAVRREIRAARGSLDCIPEQFFQ